MPPATSPATSDLATSLEVAGSLWAKFMGLMGRSSLEAGAGLWLPDSNGIHMMFMRFPIDAVFVGRPDAAGLRAVVSVHRGLRAWTGLVPLVRGAHGVLELPVGTIDATGTVVGRPDRARVGRGSGFRAARVAAVSVASRRRGAARRRRASPGAASPTDVARRSAAFLSYSISTSAGQD